MKRDETSRKWVSYLRLKGSVCLKQRYHNNDDVTDVEDITTRVADADISECTLVYNTDNSFRTYSKQMCVFITSTWIPLPISTCIQSTCQLSLLFTQREILFGEYISWEKNDTNFSGGQSQLSAIARILIQDSDWYLHLPVSNVSQWSMSSSILD